MLAVVSTVICKGNAASLWPKPLSRAVCRVHAPHGPAVSAVRVSAGQAQGGERRAVADRDKLAYRLVRAKWGRAGSTECCAEVIEDR
jgi:hypothetical protein